MRLADGAEAIRGDLPSSATRTVEVPVEAGESLDTGVQRYSSVARVKELTLTALADVTATAIVVGGDCGVSIAGIEHAASGATGSDDLAVVWFDAHGDLNTPDSSPSGALGGMALRAVMGDGVSGLTVTRAIPAGRIVLVGARDLDPEETRYIDASGITVIDADAPADAAVAAVRASGAGRVYIHIDLDVLDPAAITGVTDAVPFGLTVEALTGAITALRGEFELAGATIAGFSPADLDAAGDDLPTILRIIGSLTRG
jgi:arginase